MLFCSVKDAINFMAKHRSRLICAPLSGDQVDELGFSLMIQNNAETFWTSTGFSYNRHTLFYLLHHRCTVAWLNFQVVRILYHKISHDDGQVRF